MEFLNYLIYSKKMLEHPTVSCFFHQLVSQFQNLVSNPMLSKHLLWPLTVGTVSMQVKKKKKQNRIF